MKEEKLEEVKSLYLLLLKVASANILSRTTPTEWLDTILSSKRENCVETTILIPKSIEEYLKKSSEPNGLNIGFQLIVAIGVVEVLSEQALVLKEEPKGKLKEEIKEARASVH